MSLPPIFKDGALFNPLGEANCGPRSCLDIKRLLLEPPLDGEFCLKPDITALF